MGKGILNDGCPLMISSPLSRYSSNDLMSSSSFSGGRHQNDMGSLLGLIDNGIGGAGDIVLHLQSFAIPWVRAVFCPSSLIADDGPAVSPSNPYPKFKGLLVNLLQVSWFPLFSNKLHNIIYFPAS